MNKLFKRVMSFIMACVIVCSVINVTAFAAGGTTVTVESKTVQKGTTTVELDVSIADADPMAMMYLEVICDEGLTLGTITSTITAPAPTINGEKVSFDNIANGVDFTFGDGVIMTIPVNLSADIDDGEYSVSVRLLDNQKSSCGNMSEENVPVAFYAGTITVSSSGGETPSIPTNVTYTADLDTTSTAVKVGDEVTVNILVGGTTKEFASSELNLTYTGLTYDSSKSNVNGADVTPANGAIKIIDHGASTSWADGGNVTAYSLVFTVDAITGDSGTASVTLSDAALSTAANASGSNLTAATVTVATKEFTVTPADLAVTLPTTGDLTAPNGTTVTYGDDFTFEAVNKNYTYEISVEDADGNIVTATETASGSGVWTITDVTSDLTITIASKTAKIYTITFTDPTHTQDRTEQTYNFIYGTEGGFSFTLKDNVAPSTTPGTTYAVDSIKYTGTDTVVEHTAPETSVTTNRTYTIATEAITGNITITTSATTVNPNQFTVTLPTSTYPELTVDKTVVDLNGSVVLTLDPVAGYKYVVSVNGTAIADDAWTATPDENDGDKVTYTISDITANVSVSVSREVDTSKFTVKVMTDYVAMDGQSVHLVRVSGALDEGYVLTYGSNNMYWSTGYATGGEYVYLVITDANSTLSTEAATAQIDIAKGSPVATITYDGNVNLADTTTVDANDAQLVWNMYKANVYSAFATEATGATMEKFLRADMNHDGKIYTEDAAEIIALIKNRTN